MERQLTLINEILGLNKIQDIILTEKKLKIRVLIKYIVGSEENGIF
jgi:hypothetical protein